jgi:hypothetical protein
MYHTVPLRLNSTCLTTWREAVRIVDAEPGHEAHNVIMSVADPVGGTGLTDPGVKLVDDFLRHHDKSLQTIANTIFPAALYHRYGAPRFFTEFHEKILPKVRDKEKWSGYYFERMTSWPGTPNDNPLWDLVQRMADPGVTSRNKFELALFDPARDLNRSPYGGQCLSFLSFKTVPCGPDVVNLTAMYRNHYYIEKLLGNLIGLGRLLSFVAKEAGLKVGSLTVLSSHAKIDQINTTAGGLTRRGDITRLLAKVDEELAIKD